MKGATTGSIIGAIIGVIILLALIATAVVMIRKHRNKNKDADGPPNYKPPPPKKTGGSTEGLSASRENVAESRPLNSPYYETNGEPVTNLDAYSDEEGRYYHDSGHGNAPSDLDDSVPHDNEEAADEHLYASPVDEDLPRGGEEEAEPNPVPSRGDSFMSPAMYV